jgi:hypothetical protein
MCSRSRRILRELVMHMLVLVSTNGVNVCMVMVSLHTQRYEKDNLYHVFLPCTFPYVCTDSSKIFGSFGHQKPYLLCQYK